jgi:diguanylate cyclase (GGDEF)-like protein
MATQPPATILIADDEPVNLAFLQSIFRDEYRVVSATTGHEALRRSEEESPALIILDVLMPDISGYEVCRRLKENPATQHIPIIFVTALESEEDEEQGLQLGAVDYLTKPLRAGIIRARVRNLLTMVRQRQLLEELVLLDPLTEIPNRRALNQTLEHEWARCLRIHQPLSLAMVDIDYFKSFNDSYGHGAGDEALKRVAHVLRETAKRPGDLAARYGGEEFVVLLPHTPQRGAYKFCRQIRYHIQKLGIPHGGSPLGVLTVSIGGATLWPRQGISPSTLLEEADQQLYRAKSMGRNRVVWKQQSEAGDRPQNPKKLT